MDSQILSPQNTGQFTKVMHEAPRLYFFSQHVACYEAQSNRNLHWLGCRLLRLKLTDGKLSCIAAEFKPVPQLTEDLPPGTKLCCTNATVRLGVLLLDSKCIQARLHCSPPKLNSVLVSVVFVSCVAAAVHAVRELQAGCTDTLIPFWYILCKVFSFLSQRLQPVILSVLPKQHLHAWASSVADR